MKVLFWGARIAAMLVLLLTFSVLNVKQMDGTHGYVVGALMTWAHFGLMQLSDWALEKAYGQ